MRQLLVPFKNETNYVYVAVIFFVQLHFIICLFWGIVMFDNEFETKEG